MFDFKFEKKELLPGIYVIKLKGRDAVIGYTIFYENEKAWMWIRKDLTSHQFYKTFQEAVEALASFVILEKMDSSANKMGILNNEKFVLGRNDNAEDKL